MPRFADKQRNLISALAYLPFLSIAFAPAILFVEKDDKFIRFHAMQSLIVTLAYYFLSILINIFFEGVLIGILGAVVDYLLLILMLFFWINSMVRAYRGNLLKWPWVGNFVEKKIGK